MDSMDSVGGNRPETQPWSPTTSADCPVPLAMQAWIETSMHWFGGQFGREAALGDVSTPAPEFFPAPYSATPEQIDALVTKVCGLMSVDPSGVTVELFGDLADRSAEISGEKHAVGHYRRRNGRAVIGLDRREAADPAYLTAIIAHELCHVRLLGERRITTARKDHERLTDLLTVYLGFGIFSTNAALSFAGTHRRWSATPLGYLNERELNATRRDGYKRLGYLTEPQFAYALACYGRLRGETEPAWAAHLDPGPRAQLAQGQAYLARTGPGDGFPTLRTITHRRTPIRMVMQEPSPWPLSPPTQAVPELAT
jgi:hypothetical protein